MASCSRYISQLRENLVPNWQIEIEVRPICWLSRACLHYGLASDMIANIQRGLLSRHYLRIRPILESRLDNVDIERIYQSIL